MGPGLAVKALCGRHFSLMLFGFSQVAIDIEPLVHIIRDDNVLHGVTHTYVGATPVALVALFAGRPLCQFFLNYWTPDPDSRFLYWLRGPRIISWPAAIAGAFVGTYSHIFLDSIMHADMHPLAPLSPANALWRAIPVESLHVVCVLSGLAGMLLLIAVFLFRKKR
jgi:hypothetical protein